MAAAALTLACVLGAAPAAYADDGSKCAVADCNGTYANGFCSEVDTHYEQPALKDGWYRIANAGNLYWFAQLVNGGEVAANAVLTADITVNEDLGASDLRAWTPIGNSAVTKKSYGGTFDGAGCTVKGLYCSYGSLYNIGLFGRCEGAVLKGITVAGSHFYADQSVAAIAGQVAGTQVVDCHSVGNKVIAVSVTVGGVVGGSTGSTIERCSSTSEVGHADNGSVNEGWRAGGILGYAFGDTVITDCWNSGEVYARRLGAGGIVGGQSAGLTVENCHNVGTVSLIASSTERGACGPVLGIRYRDKVTDPWPSLKIENFYYLEAVYSRDNLYEEEGAEIVEKSADAFASGEVTWLLNGETAKGAVWRQTLGSDPYPGFTGKVVYCGDDGAYSNTPPFASADVSVAGGCVYNGEAQEPAVTVTLGDKTLVEDEDYDVSYENNVNAGEGTVIITGKGEYAGKNVTATFTIANAGLREVYVLQKGSLAYTGDALTPIVDAHAVTVDGVPATFAYSTERDGTYGSMPSFTDAGIYDVYYKVSAPNHDGAQSNFRIEVVTADNAWTVEPAVAGWTYGENPGVTAPTAKFGEVTVEYFGIANDDETYQSSEPPTKAGDYHVAFTVAGTGNYGGLEAEFLFTINKADYDMSNAKWDYANPFTHDGLEKGVFVTGLPEGVTVAGYEGNEAAEPGDYEAAVSLGYDSANYNEPEMSPLSWSIESDWVPTEAVEKIAGVTAENVELEDGEDLEKAKEDLESALGDEAKNYSDEAKETIEEELARVDGALKVLEDVEDVESLINDLPATIVKDDEAAIKAAEDAYDALSDHGKSLVSEDARKKLADAQAALETAKKAEGALAPSGDDVPAVGIAFAALAAFVTAAALLALMRRRRAA